jgi:hypothetical protein
MNDDEIAQALEQAEEEVARIEAEIIGSATVPIAAAAAAPLSLASLSVQCKSMALVHAVNIGLNARNAPTAWAQNEASCMDFAALAPKLPPPPNLIPHRDLLSAPAAATATKVGSRFSNSWKRSLLAAASLGRPLAAAWSDAISSGSAADKSDRAVSVPCALLRFLPLIDAQFADYGTRDDAVSFSHGGVQVRFSDYMHSPLRHLTSCRFSCCVRPRSLRSAPLPPVHCCSSLSPMPA